MAKKKIEDKLASFKNVSNDETVVYASEMRKENTKKKIQEKIKAVKEKETVVKVEEKVKTENEEKIELTTEVTAPIENNLETPKVEIIEELVATVEDSVETIEELVATVEDNVETIEDKVETVQETPKQEYSVKRMFGYDWMGVVYEE